MTTPTIEELVKWLEDHVRFERSALQWNPSANPSTVKYDAAAKGLRDLAAAQEALKFVERWANHHGVKPTCTAEAALSIIQHYPPILAITRSYADGKVPETRNPWAELKEAQEARERAEARVKSLVLDLSAAIGRYQRAEERAAACEKDAERVQGMIPAIEINANSFRYTRTGTIEQALDDLDAILGIKTDAAIAARAK